MALRHTETKHQEGRAVFFVIELCFETSPQRRESYPRPEAMQCSQCQLQLPWEAFSKRQRKREAGGRCQSCITAVQPSTDGATAKPTEEDREARQLNAYAVFEHKVSKGRVDGKKHKIPSSSVRDRAPRLEQSDRDHMESLLSLFEQTFQLHGGHEPSDSPVPVSRRRPVV